MKRNLLGISALTLAGLYFLLSVVVLGVCLITGFPLLIGIIFSIIIVLLQFLISPYLTNLSMRWFYKARFDHEFPDYLDKFIDEICQKYKMKRPKIGFIDDGSPNAFTYGHTKNDATIILTRGIFELLSKDEVLAVVGHELGHATHYDMLFMTVAQLVPLVLYLIYEGLTDSNNNDNNKGAIIGYVAYLLYIIANYIVLWLSRTREYYADEFSIQETKNPNALAEALVKIGFGLVTNKDSNDSKKKKHSTENVGALGIFDSKTSKSLIVMTDNNPDDKSSIKNAMKWEMWNPWATYYEIHSTHPLISKRLIAISKYSEDYNQKPYIKFDLKKPESYVDDFFLELFIYFAPIVCILATLVCAIIFRSHLLLVIGIGLLPTAFFSFIAFNRSHRKGYKKTTVQDLLGEVKVSKITSISCELNGKIIGRGDPGYIFNEDFMIKDDTGIIYIDYNSPLYIINKIVALFKTPGYLDKDVKVRGWYRRGPVPYVEVYDFIIDGKKHATGQYTLGIVFNALLAIAGVVLIVVGLV